MFSQLIPLRLGQIKTRRKCKELKGGLAKEGRRRRGKKQIEKGKKKRRPTKRKENKNEKVRSPRS